MAGEYPYVSSKKSISPLFEQIARRTPPKVDDTWLVEVGGVPRSAAIRFRSLLRDIKFVDSAFAPTQSWHDYHAPSRKVTLARAIRTGYSDLYQEFPKAHEARDEQITRYIRSSTKLGDNSVKLVVETFKALVALADFDQEEAQSKSDGQDGVSKESTLVDLSETLSFKGNQRQVAGMTFNINLQLTLPESTEPAVYEALFAALEKHLLAKNSDE